MTDILTQTLEWIVNRPYWEQFALKRIIDGQAFSDEVYDQLIQFCLEDAGIEEAISIRPEINWSENPQGFSSESVCTKVIQLSNLQNVNALAKDQTLTFHPDLTVIYGANGSGKSGYSRMLAHAGFSRGDSTIHPDVMKNQTESENISFDLVFIVGNEQHAVTYIKNEQNKKLYSLYVFDSTSVVRHLTKSEKISFSPSGLIYFSQLGDVVNKCLERLETKTRKYFEPHKFENLFPEQTEVRRSIISNEYSKLKALSKLNKQEIQRIQELSIEISRLKIESVADKINHLKQIITDLKNLIRQLFNVENVLTIDIEEINKDLNLCSLIKSKIKTEGLDRFRTEQISGIGSPEWIDLINSAHIFAKTQLSKYPDTEDNCLLCHQKLTPESHQLLKSLWVFLEEDLQSKLNKTQLDLKLKIKKIENLKFDFFNEQTVIYRYLQQTNPELIININNFIKTCNQFKVNSINLFEKLQNITSDFECISPAPELESLVTTLVLEINSLNQTNSADVIDKLEKEYIELHHRSILKINWEDINSYYTNIQWANKSKKALGSTRHITQKHNELFQLLVTDRYINLFKQTLKELNCPLNVIVSTKGRQAEVFKQIILESPTSSAKPENILSEGEKRAVAIADFITEATLDENCSVIVLDDPVTSLDHDWKETMARRLVTESVKRQVIIFTHDRPFLSLIKRFSEEQNIELFSHSIERKFDDSPGYIHLNYSPDLVDDYKKVGKSVDLLVRARNAKTPEESRFLIQQGFNALRTTYEAFILLKLFAGVVRRFDPHIRVNNLKDIHFDTEILNKVIEKFNYISRFTGGHLPSDQSELELVSADKLDFEIKEFQALEKQLSDLKKIK